MKPRLCFKHGRWWCRGVKRVATDLYVRDYDIEGNGACPREAYIDWVGGRARL